MSFETIRVYVAGQFQDTELPRWYDEACALSERKGLDWHRAFEHVLECEYRPLTEEGLCSAGLEIRVWQSEKVGAFVIIETPLALVEQILVPAANDWLPFLATYLAPLMTSSAHYAMHETQTKFCNAFIAWARHGEGSHVGRETGLSRIDLDNDRDRRQVERDRAAGARTGNGGVA